MVLGLVNGNISGGTIYASSSIEAGGHFTVGSNAYVTGDISGANTTIYAGSNVFAGGDISGGAVYATNNMYAGGAVSGTNVYSTGDLIGNYVIGLSEISGAAVYAQNTFQCGGDATIGSNVSIGGNISGNRALFYGANAVLDNLSYPSIWKYADYTMSQSGKDTVVLADTSVSGNMVITLPDSTLSQNLNRVYIVKKVDSTANGSVVLLPSGGKVIDGAANKVLATQWSSATIVNDGENWFVI